MKTINITIIAVIFFLSPCLAHADGPKNELRDGSRISPAFHNDDRDHGKGANDRRPERVEDRRGDRDHGKGQYDHHPDRYRERRDYHDYHGHRERPYDSRRHYGHYEKKGHRYDYDGHWRSWKEWDAYSKKNPHMLKQGQYYRDNAHLMFRFCEPGSGSCIFFSIGD